MNKTKENNKKISLLYSCLLFFYLGITTFGGISTMLFVIKRELVDKRKLMSEEELYNDVSLSQCSPGIIMVNIATLFGVKYNGIIGAILTTLCLVAGPWSVICALTYLLKYINVNPNLITSIYSGIRASVCAIALVAVATLVKKNIKNLFSAVIAISLFILITIFNINPIYTVLISITSGLFYDIIKKLVKKRANND